MSKKAKQNEIGIETANRKDRHIDLVIKENVQTKTSTWLECIQLIHNSLPEMSFEEIDCSVKFLGKSIQAPIIIGALTGGTQQGKIINETLARAAQAFQIPMMLGSQRVSLDRPEARETFSIARKVAPDIPLIGNIGIAQIATAEDFGFVHDLIGMIDADALAIHLNPLQEIIQPEGNLTFKNGLAQISKLRQEISIPLIVKETGAGISKDVARHLIDRGIHYLDTAGTGGTSFAAVEYYRAKEAGNSLNAQIGKQFWNWGIPTAASIFEIGSVANPETKIIGSGGIRTGLDIAKSLAIGAHYTALAQPFLEPALENFNEVEELITSLIHELKVTMFLTGAKTISDLRKVSYTVTAPLSKWLKKRNIEY